MHGTKARQCEVKSKIIIASREAALLFFPNKIKLNFRHDDSQRFVLMAKIIFYVSVIGATLTHKKRGDSSPPAPTKIRQWKKWASVIANNGAPDITRSMVYKQRFLCVCNRCVNKRSSVECSINSLLRFATIVDCRVFFSRVLSFSRLYFLNAWFPAWWASTPPKVYEDLR